MPFIDDVVAGYREQQRLLTILDSFFEELDDPRMIRHRPDLRARFESLKLGEVKERSLLQGVAESIGNMAYLLTHLAQAEKHDYLQIAVGLYFILEDADNQETRQTQLRDLYNPHGR